MLCSVQNPTKNIVREQRSRSTAMDQQVKKYHWDLWASLLFLNLLLFVWSIIFGLSSNKKSYYLLYRSRSVSLSLKMLTLRENENESQSYTIRFQYWSSIISTQMLICEQLLQDAQIHGKKSVVLALKMSTTEWRFQLNHWLIGEQW